jgi:hypothetical protein
MRTHVRHVALCLLAAFVTATAVGCAADTDADIEEAESASSTSAAATSSEKVLSFQYQVQQTGYWCGPSATRAVLSARIASPPSQQQLANELPTDTDGTDWIGQVTKVLDKYIGGYETREMPNDPPTAAQKSALWSDIVRSIDGGYGVVANIVAPASNHPPGYPNYTIYHYIAVMGYDAPTSRVYIADSANFGGNKMYWLSFNQLATLIPPKGYSAWFPKGTTCPGGRGTVMGAIEAKYKELGGCDSVLGAPITEELPTADKVGRYTHFENGSIYWHPNTGAHEVHGAIREVWKSMGWELKVLGYPTTDEIATSDGSGRKNVFQGGAIYSSAATGTHEVYGDIRAKWVSLGEEKSELGLPTSGEYAIAGGRRNDFEHGSISWQASNRSTTVKVTP